MKLTEIEDILQSKNWQFEVSSNNPAIKYGKQTLESVRSMHESFDKYLRKVAQSQGSKQIGLQAYQKNGSSHLKKGFYLVDIEPVVETQTESTKGVGESTEFVDGPKTPVSNSPTTTSKKMEDYTALIENNGLKTEVRFLTAERDTLKEKATKLERKNEELHDQVLKLSRDLATKESSLDLDFKKKELELLNQRKQGLAGIMDEIKTLPPEAWQFLAGFIKNHPMNQGNNSAAPKQIHDAEAVVLDGAAKHTDPEAQTNIENVYKLLVAQPAESIAMIAMLVDYFTKHNDHLIVAFDKFFPGIIQKTTPPARNSNDPTDDPDDNNE